MAAIVLPFCSVMCEVYRNVEYEDSCSQSIAMCVVRAVQCIVVQCIAVQCIEFELQCIALDCSVLHCSAVQFSTVQCSVVQYSSMQLGACTAVEFSEHGMEFAASKG